MRSIFTKPVWGLLPLDDGFAYINYEPYHEGRVIASFWQFFIATGQMGQITQDAYLRYKFGDNYRRIFEEIPPEHRLSCQTALDSSGRLMALFPQSGEFCFFDSSGTLYNKGSLRFNGAPVTSPVFAGDSWWGICRQKNAVLNINSGDWTWDFAAGGEGRADFPEPVHLSAYPGRDGSSRLYVCCMGGESIRSLNPDRQQLFIRDFCALPGYQPLRYFRTAGRHLVLLESGIIEL